MAIIKDKTISVSESVHKKIMLEVLNSKLLKTADEYLRSVLKIKND